MIDLIFAAVKRDVKVVIPGVFSVFYVHCHNDIFEIVKEVVSFLILTMIL